MKSATIVPMFTALAAAMLAAVPARASDWSSAVDVCQGSLPSFEGALRKRPLAIANEGTSSAFVSCSIRAPLNQFEEVTGIIVLFTNRGASTRLFSCTLVDGVALPFPAYPPVYQPKPILLEAGNFGGLTWTNVDDNGNEPYRIPNLNCSLPPGIEINVIQMSTDTPL